MATTRSTSNTPPQGGPVEVNEGNGTDVVNISPSAQFLDNIKGAVGVAAM